jgi:formylmethanofuran dehydrogenase subunit C
MRDGVILVEGSTGDEAGARMRRGLIAVAGAAGDGLGSGIVAGSLFAFGTVGRFPGSGMKRGTIALFGPHPPGLLPSFAFAGVYRFPFLALYLRRLAAWGFAVPDDAFGAVAGRYNGDLADGGLGEVLIVGGAAGR